MCSLSSAKWSSKFEVVVNVSSLSFSCEGQVVLRSNFSHYLNINILDIVDREGLAFLVVQELGSLGYDLVHPGVDVGVHGLVLGGVD